MSRPSANAAEGRATRARPSLCLLLLCIAALAIPAFDAAAAQAQPVSLVLTESDPDSSESDPAESTTPLLFGEEDDGSDTSAVPFGVEDDFPVLAAVNPDNEVAIYASLGDCNAATSPVAIGTVGELETEGIEVEVEPDSVTTFFASQTELGDPTPSKCATGLSLTYWEGSPLVTPPTEPPPSEPPPGSGSPPTGGLPPAPARPSSPPIVLQLRTIPGGRANDNTPLVTGEAPGANTVRIFDNAHCSGAPVAKGPADQFTVGLEVQVADNTTTSFYANAVNGSGLSACSAPVTYVEDSTAPRTRITMAPGVKTRKRTAVFRFTNVTDDPPGTSFLCKVDRRKWKQCRSPLRLRRLPRKAHVVRVKAIDSAGNAEQKGAKRRFKVVRLP